MIGKLDDWNIGFKGIDPISTKRLVTFAHPFFHYSNLPVFHVRGARAS
jgi:hypothetical protein